jgi:hypothetical protein
MNANKITQSLALAAAMIALSIALVWAGKAGLIAGDLAMRLSMIASGLLIAFYGNVIPKLVLRSAQARSARRFAGWAFVLSGLTCAVVWALAPIAVAKPVSIAMIASTVVLVFGVCMLTRRAARSD